jgi:hypothetical protein
VSTRFSGNELGSEPFNTILEQHHLSRFLDEPKQIHCDMVRQILYYLRGTPHYSIHYSKTEDETIEGFVDSSWANSEDYTSIYGYGFLFNNSLISWCSKKQKTVALSSTEAEYMALTHGTQEALWFIELLHELGIPQETIILNEDNEASIKMANNPQEYKRTRHIQVRYHFIREHIKDKKILLRHCPTQNQLADIFTKGVSSVRLLELLPKLGISLFSKHGRELNYAKENSIAETLRVSGAPAAQVLTSSEGLKGVLVKPSGV